MNAAPVTIDLVSDPVCPWCYVGVRSFLKARAAIGADRMIVTRYRPFMLNPALPKSGVDRHAYYRAKFPDAGALAAAGAALVRNAEEAGFSFDPSAPAHLPNTLKAHQLIRFAHKSGRQDAMTRAIYAAFWDGLQDIGDDETLIDLAGEADLDREEARALLASADDAASLAHEAEMFRRAGVSGVPTFIVNNRTGFSGGMPPAALGDALARAIELSEAQP
jgi:predicted DsbA family dithiol-disulfide isomerase